MEAQISSTTSPRPYHHPLCLTSSYMPHLILSALPSKQSTNQPLLTHFYHLGHHSFGPVHITSIVHTCSVLPRNILSKHKSNHDLPFKTLQCYPESKPKSLQFHVLVWYSCQNKVPHRLGGLNTTHLLSQF
jgi:hypothetical protein